MRTTASLLTTLVLFMAACQSAANEDYDADGILAKDDCNDYNAAIGTKNTYFADVDHDGWGDANSTELACDAPKGFSEKAGDCDDTTPAINPQAKELCNEADDDCDGQIDDGVDKPIWFEDLDGDGFGNPAAAVEDCDGEGYVSNDRDCDDADNGKFPGNPEVCDGIDNNCNGIRDDNAVDRRRWYLDADNDGFGVVGKWVEQCDEPRGYTDVFGDCNDQSPAVNPDAIEVCDGIDNDCVDGIDVNAIDASTWYADLDHDGYGDPDAAIVTCTAPSYHVANSDDCDDTSKRISPDTVWYADDDSDGYGSDDDYVVQCVQPSGYLSSSGDCDDGDGDIHPGETEYCDGADNDCDGTVDQDAVDMTTWYEDADGDGYGNPDLYGDACDQPGGFADNGDDCDDTDENLNPTAAWYYDSDLDGFGDPDDEYIGCTPPSGYVVETDDCNDADWYINPDADEVCDYVDNDCDGATDASDSDYVGNGTYYEDADADGFGNVDSTTSACGAPSGYVRDSADCDDDDEDVNPDVAEICNDGVDNNCDGGPGSCGLSGNYSLSSADYSYGGSSSSYYIGRNVAAAGDLNGDGYADYGLGSYYAGGGYGAIYVYYGAATPTTATNVHTTYDVYIRGVNSSDYFGWESDWADVNGDGYDDLLVGAPYADPVYSSAGGVFVFYGSATGLSSSSMYASAADVTFTYTTTYGYQGKTVTGIPDLNGDGYDEVGYGPYSSSYATYVFAGSNSLSGTYTSTSALATISNGGSCSSTIGYSDVSAGDIDGDGAGDFLVGCYYYGSYRGAGLLFMSDTLSGSITAANADYAFQGAATSEYAGYSLAADGDANGDGYDDILLGAYQADITYSNSGSAYVFYGSASPSSLTGSSADLIITGESASSYLGYSTDFVDDSNGDGQDDILIGAYYYSSKGRAYLFMGGTEGTMTGASASATFDAVSSADYAGYDVAGTGDVNGDGLGDLMIGAYYADANSYTSSGVGYLFLGEGL